MVRRMNNLSTDHGSRSAAPAHDRHLDRGVLAREQLISHATRIFAAKGFAAATTARSATRRGQTSRPSITTSATRKGCTRRAAATDQGDDRRVRSLRRSVAPFDQAMRMFLAPFIAPSTGDIDRDVMRIHLREMMEPSEVFREITAQTIVRHTTCWPAHSRVTAAGRTRCRYPPARIRDGGHGP